MFIKWPEILRWERLLKWKLLLSLYSETNRAVWEPETRLELDHHSPQGNCYVTTLARKLQVCKRRQKRSWSHIDWYKHAYGVQLRMSNSCFLIIPNSLSLLKCCCMLKCPIAVTQVYESWAASLALTPLTRWDEIAEITNHLWSPMATSHRTMDGYLQTGPEQISFWCDSIDSTSGIHIREGQEIRPGGAEKSAINRSFFFFFCKHLIPIPQAALVHLN